MPFRGDPGNVAAAGLQGGWDALAQLIAERKKDELLRYTQEQDRLQFQQTQRKMDETEKWQRLQFEANERDRAERRALALQTQKNTEQLRADQNVDRDIAQTVRTYRDVPGGAKITSGVEFGKLQQAGLTPQLTWDPIQEGRPQSWTYQGGADWQQREAGREQAKTIADDRLQAAEDRERQRFEDKQFLMTMASNLRANQPLSPHQRGTMERALGNDYRRETTAFKTMVGNLANMESAYARALKGERIGSDESIVVMFERALDPNSVVRESEYARVGGGAPFLDRMKGMIERAREGGAGLTAENLRTLVTLSRDFTNNAKMYADSAKARADSFADEYTLDRQRIYGEPLAVPPPTPESTPPRVVKVTPRR